MKPIPIDTSCCFAVESGDCCPSIIIYLRGDGNINLSYTPLKDTVAVKSKVLSFEKFNNIFAKAFFDFDFGGPIKNFG